MGLFAGIGMGLGSMVGLMGQKFIADNVSNNDYKFILLAASTFLVFGLMLYGGVQGQKIDKKYI